MLGRAALHCLVRVMAVDLSGEHIRVNAVAPSTVDTPMIRNAVESDGLSGYKTSGTLPLGHISIPSDIVGVICLLLAPVSNYIDGAMILVDGGTSAAFVAGGPVGASAPGRIRLDRSDRSQTLSIQRIAPTSSCPAAGMPAPGPFWLFPGGHTRRPAVPIFYKVPVLLRGPSFFQGTA